jgi:hypothetical protein
MFPMFPSFRPPSRPASEPMLPSHPPSTVSAGRRTSRGSIEQVQQSRAGNEIMTYSLAGIVEPTEVSLPRVLQHLLQPLDHPGAFLVARARATPAYARRRSRIKGLPAEVLLLRSKQCPSGWSGGSTEPLLRAHTQLGDTMLPWTIALAVLALAVLARKLLADRALRRGADRRPGRPRRVTGPCRPCGGGSGRFGGHGRPDRRLRSPRRVDRTVQPRLEGAPAEHPRSGQARQLRAGADLGRVLGDSAKPAAAPADPPDQGPVRWDRMLRGQRVARGHPASESCVDSASITTAPPMGSTATTGPMALKSTRSRHVLI